MQLFRKPNTFCCLFTAFMESTFNGKYFQKKLNLIAYVFLNLLTPKDAVTEAHKSSMC